MNWHGVFAPDVPLLEIFVRGTITYLALYFLLRVFRNRTSGRKGLSDLLLIVLLADAVQNAMAGQYNSISAGIVLAFTIAFWAWLLNWIRYRIPWARRFLRSHAELVIRDGAPYRPGLRRELMTLDDLDEELRKLGITDLSDISRGLIEEDGTLTIERNSARG